MRKTVFFIRFALCIAIGLVGSGLFATARAISVPNPFVKAQGISVRNLPNDTIFASMALYASEKPAMTDTAVSSEITHTEFVEPVEQAPDTTQAKEHTESIKSSAGGLVSAEVTASLVSDIPTPLPPVASPSPAAPTPTTSPTSPTTPEVTSQPSTGGLSAPVLFALVNATRTNAGLPAFENNDAVCSLASVRAPEIHNEIYGTSYMHAGFFARAAGSGMTENIISMNSEQNALNWWMNSPVHRSAILGNYKYSCLACSGDSCSEIFSH